MWSYNYTYPNYLAHYGVLGMKWGVRRRSKSSNSSNTSKSTKTSSSKNNSSTKKSTNQRLKTAAKIGVGVAAAGLAIYGGYKVSQMVRSNQANVAAGKRIMANYQKGQDYKANAKKMQKLYSKGYINAIHKSNDAYKIADTAMKGRLTGTGMIYNNGYHEALSNARSADKVVDAFQKKRDQYGIRAGGALSTILRTRN